MFQFLIGWLQTVVEKLADCEHHSFQFLIGWLQTSLRDSHIIGTKVVSIPYRLATNLYLSADTQLLVLVSIPYRLATNKLQKKL